MAIRKTSANLFIKVKTRYQLNVGGKLEKMASKKNVEAVKGLLTLASNKKIMSQGNKN